MARMRESIMKDQNEFIMRKSDGEEAGLEASDKTALKDIKGLRRSIPCTFHGSYIYRQSNQEGNMH